jgi:hypothetical protein
MLLQGNNSWPSRLRGIGCYLAECRAQVTLGFSGGSLPGCEGDFAAHNREVCALGESPFEESLGREGQATHEIPEARVGPN